MMHARVSRYRGKPGQAGEAATAPNPPELEAVPGFLGVWVLVDHDSGDTISMTLWESEQAMVDSKALANRLRDEFNKQLGASEPASVETYEVMQHPELRAKESHA
jgi:heme-degrading monooxygenase HmoA